MAKPMNLVPGRMCKPATAAQMTERVAVLRATVEKYLPEFVKAVADKEGDIVVMHQDAFASGYDIDEYTLLGLAVKYAGLFGRPVTFTGLNRETC